MNATGGGAAQVDGAAPLGADFELTCELSISQACRRDDPLSATHVARPRHEHNTTPDRLLCSPCLTTLNYRPEGSCLTCDTTFKPASAGFIVEVL